ncbi:MAG: hypothetical protein PGN08_03025 [Sphingomonas taxi]
MFTKVDEYLLKYKNDYLNLLGIVRTAVEDVGKSLPGVISNAYSRPDSGLGPFKESNKIASKMRRKGGFSARNLTALSDVIGYTVVVQYPDQRELVFSALKKALAAANVRIDEKELEKHENKRGYFAHHAICRRRYGSDELKCEIQIKTMLHDAWSKKMHDLTYKPAGRLDHRLAALMEAGSVTIESVEQQSQLVRDMIMANWQAETEARRAARKELFDMMVAQNAQVVAGHPDASRIAALHRQIEATGPHDGGAIDDAAFEGLQLEVDDLCSADEAVSYAWILYAHLASRRPDERQTRKCIVELDTLLDNAPELLKAGKITIREIAIAPLIFYVMGELALSVEYFDRLLTSPVLALDAQTRSKIQFNRLNALVELEYHFPSDEPQAVEVLRREVESCLADPQVTANGDIATSVADLRGLADITFATTCEQVRRGIAECDRAAALASDDEKRVSDAYADLNTRRGWRRFFELEVTSRIRPQKP